MTKNSKSVIFYLYIEEKITEIHSVPFTYYQLSFYKKDWDKVVARFPSGRTRTWYRVRRTPVPVVHKKPLSNSVPPKPYFIKGRRIPLYNYFEAISSKGESFD